VNIFPDRIKFFLAVAATAALPRPWRIATRARLLRRLHRSKSRNADIMVINHPKSGATWFRVMLSRLYQMHYGLPPRRIVKSDEFYNHNHAMPRFLVSSGYYTYESATQDVFDEILSCNANDKKVIFLARHPCDLAVSWFFQFTKRTKAYKRELIKSTLRHPFDKSIISMWDFVMHEELGLSGVIDFHNMWERRLANNGASLMIRYEEMRSHPVDTMSRVTEFLDAPFTRSEIEQAVEFGSFDNMRKLEPSGYFLNSSMSLRNKKDPGSLKVRRGKVGGFRDYFTDDQVAIMDEMVRSRLSPTFGYYPEPRTVANRAVRSGYPWKQAS